MSNQRSIQWNFEDQRVEPGAEWRHERTTSMAVGEYDVVLTYATDGGGTRQEKARLEVTNSAEAAAREACKECNGDFGPHGRRGVVSCHCRTKDGGKPCDDGKDCEGKCVSTEGGFVCSEFPFVYGCHSYLPDGWSEQPHPEPVRIPSICVD